jgi:catechol 2,3-dioxygenase-like lactoylglutathione lyase family enzyme
MVEVWRRTPREKEGQMLAHSKAYSGFAVSDLDKARDFYQNTLGVTAGDRMGMLELRFDDGHAVLVYPKPDHQPANYTILNFPVEDLEKTVSELTARGVEFARYDGFDQDELGIARAPQGPPIAWFTDPSGNILSVHGIV